MRYLTILAVLAIVILHLLSISPEVRSEHQVRAASSRYSSDLLHTADLFYRAEFYPENSTLLTNEGTRSEPLQLGPTLNAEGYDPTFVQDSSGKYLKYTLNQGQFAQAFVPSSVLNGSFSFAIWYRAGAAFADSLLVDLIDEQFGEAGKRYMLHRTAGNYYSSRVWTPSGLRYGITSTSKINLNQTQLIVVTWDNTTYTHKLYINRVPEGTVVGTSPRSTVVSSPLQLPLPGTTLKPAGRLYGIAWADDVVWTPEQVATLPLSLEE